MYTCTTKNIAQAKNDEDVKATRKEMDASFVAYDVFATASATASLPFANHFNSNVLVGDTLPQQQQLCGRVTVALVHGFDATHFIVDRETLFPVRH